jgi:hypothetical protein
MSNNYPSLEEITVTLDNGRTVVDKWQIQSFDHATQIAEEQTERFGRRWVATDRGAKVCPRFSTVEAPQIGDLVSSNCDGESWPEGEIVRVTGGTFALVKTSTGATFRRHGQTGAWINTGGTLRMIRGHVREINPQF